MLASVHLLTAAWCLELAVGWPPRLHAVIGHPVAWLGTAVSWLEQRLNLPSRPPLLQWLAGAATTLIIVAGAVAAAAALGNLSSNPWITGPLELALAASLLASRSLYTHVRDVADQLSNQGLEAGRRAVARIVGRDVTDLDAGGICRAAIESLAENTSDGVVAPLFWGLLLGLPGLAGYKTINTLDSMIGHRSRRYRYFGQLAARLDDIANFVPARLTGWLFVATAGRPRRCASVMRRHARQHQSPNAGWPEAAMAGALDVQLAGPRRYAGQNVSAPWMNRTGAPAGPLHIDRALALYRLALSILAAALVLGSVLALARA